MEENFASIGISHTEFMIYKLSMVHEVLLQQKEALASPQGSMWAKHS
jgi:hypothetical protein